MKLLLGRALLTMLAVTQTACQTSHETKHAMDYSAVKIVAHRGCLSEGPENSLPAIFDCFGKGVDIVETDIQLSAENIPVMIHDTTLDRTTTGAGPVNAMPLKQITALQLKSGFGGAGADITSLSPPQLEDVLLELEKDQLINLDVKDPKAFAPTSQLLRKYQRGKSIILKTSMSPDNADFETFSNIGGALFMPVIRECLDGVKPKPDIYCAHNVTEIISDFKEFELYGVELIFSNEAFLTEISHALRPLGLEIWVNALSPLHSAGHTDRLALDDPDAHWGRLVELGATIIQTDYPIELQEYLAQRDLGIQP